MSLAFLLLSLFTLTLTSLFVTSAVREELISLAEANLKRHAESIATLMGKSMDDVALTAEQRRRLVSEMVRLSGEFQGRMCIVNWEGEVLEDSDPQGEKQVKKYFEVYEALNGRYHYELRGDTLYLAVPILAKGRTQGAVYASRPLLEVDQLMSGLYERTQTAGLAVLLLSAALSLLLGRSVTNPVKKLSEGVRKISRGDYDFRLKLRRGDELGRLASDVDRMAANLASHREVLMQFVSDASHELKTPIASVKALTEGLQDGALDDPETAQRFLTLLSSEADRMQNLVESLLCLQRLEGEPELKRESFELAEAVRSVIEPFALSHQISVQGEAGFVFADRQAVFQILNNLTSNGIRAGEPVEVRWDVKADSVEISVSDRGSGLAEEELEKVFQRFYRTEQSRSRESGGTGLGLSICRRLVEAHGERIWLENRPGGGLSAHFTLQKSSNSSSP